MDIRQFWAKTTDDAEKRENAFHPLICHLIDVGTTALMLWEKVLPEATKKRLAEVFDLENDLKNAGKLIAFLIALHDLGKCSPPFALRGQDELRNESSLKESLKRHSRKSFYGKKVWGKLQTIRLLELYRNTSCYCEISKSTSDAPHNFVTGVILPPILKDRFRFPKLLAANIAEIIGGHHGTFPDSNYLTTKTGDAFCGDEVWRKAQAELTSTLAELFGIEEKFSHLPDKKLDNAPAMIFAGLTTVADWIGSNTDFFRCKIEDSREVLDKNFEWFDLEEYFDESKTQAAEALEKLGWSNWIREVTEKEFDDLFSELKGKHRHLQDAAIEITTEPEFNSTGIAVVESPTGEGKTEAAMFLADAWNAKLGTRGIYFALPTQATSNQMFGRVTEFLEARFAGENINVQLMLQHGHASISYAFIEKQENFQNIQNTYDDADKSNSFSNVTAAEWFTYKKRGLLVPFGVGTIDQILLAVLQTKHVFVRLFGLANKTVIIDEVHAYDAYMSTLLERLLEWLAALGSPVIILSATLPEKKRDSLIKAYLKGLGKNIEDLTNIGEKDEYPRISYATGKMPENTFRIRRLNTSDQNTRTLNLEWKTEDNFVGELKEKLKGGGCAAIICNTVDKAQTLYVKLSEDEFFRGEASDDEPKLDLLHARFRYKDRELREKRAVLRFGKKDGKVLFTENGKTFEKTVKRPDCAVLISTQIIEQSLDLDFDLMISELAPADLLLQRAGRLQRHERERLPAFKDEQTQKPQAELWLIKPPTDANGKLFIKKNSPDFGKSGIVYDKHILLRSWLKLYKDMEDIQIQIPNNVEEIIEDTYNTDKHCFDIKYEKVWNETLDKYKKDSRNEETEAEERWIARPLVPKIELYQIVGKQEEQLEEDSLAFHEKVRALTRLNADSIKIICLYGSDKQAFLDADGVNPIDVKNVVSSKNNDEEKEKIIKANIKDLLYNSIPINRRDLILAVLRAKETEIPPEWEKSPLLKSCRVLWLDEDSSAEIENFSVYLHSQLGLRVHKFKEENDG